MKTIIFSILTIMPSLAFSQFTTLQGPRDCETIVEYTQWEPSDTTQCEHQWVYARPGDIPANAPTVTPCVWSTPCPCSHDTHEARVCRLCLFHQTRREVVSYRERQKSEYLHLLEKTNKQ